MAVLLVCVTLIQGMGVTRSGGFVFCEFLLNFAITVDFSFRLKLQGVKRFFFKQSGRLVRRNFIDASVVALCNLMFIMAVLLPRSLAESVFDGLEETFLVIWCVFSLVRMFLIAKHHQIAKQNA